MPFVQSKWRQYMMLLGRAAAAAPALLATRVASVRQRPSDKAADDRGHVQVTRERVVTQSVIPVYGYKIAQVHPHDRTSYTQGLVVESGVVYEGTGLYGQSKLRQWELRSGRILNEIDLDPNYFGEGITALDGTIYQLTYLSNTGFTYDQGTLRRKDSFRYITQGWGLTNDGKQLLMSNGSSAIVVVDPKIVRRRWLHFCVRRHRTRWLSQRAALCRRQAVCQCLADGLHCHHRPEDREDQRMD